MFSRQNDVGSRARTMQYLLEWTDTVLTTSTMSSVLKRMTMCAIREIKHRVYGKL